MFINVKSAKERSLNVKIGLHVSEKMLVKEVMTKNIVTIDADKSVYDASDLLREKKIGSVIVLDKEGDVGLVTKRDIIGGTILAHKNPETTPVSEIMITDIITVHPLENIQNAVDLMGKNKIRKLIVVKDKVILGIITVTDISWAIKDVVKRVMDTYFREETEIH